MKITTHASNKPPITKPTTKPTKCEENNNYSTKLEVILFSL